MNDQNTFEESNSGSEEVTSHDSAQKSDDLPPKKDSSLEALVEQEQTIAHRRLMKELGREPTQEEIDKWLQAHTESY